MTVARCPAALAGRPPLRCGKPAGHAGAHKAVDLARRATYRWQDEEG